MELQLDRRLSNKRIYPAVDILASAPAAKIYFSNQLIEQALDIAPLFVGYEPHIEAMEFFERPSRKNESNEEFLASMND